MSPHLLRRATPLYRPGERGGGQRRSPRRGTGQRHPITGGNTLLRKQSGPGRAGGPATLQNNGYYRGQIAATTVIDHENSLVDIDFYTTTGNPARVGDVELTGESGLTEAQFRKQGKLKRNSKVNRNTVSRALRNLRKHYNKRERLAATISLTSSEYVPPTNRLNYTFLAHQGPIVLVKVQGAKISHSQLEKLVPVYEEGTVDQDLLNEGAQNLRNYFEGQGYFDVKVTHAAGAY